MTPSQIKIILTSSALIVCVGLSVVFNRVSMKGISAAQKLSETADAQSNSLRGPASQIYEQLRSGTLAIERKFAIKIAQVRDRGIASLGRPADPLENLRFGVLEGKYALKMNGDKISDINFVDNPESEGRPSEIKNRFEFLKKYGSLLDGKSDAYRVSVDIKGTKIIETYRLKSGRPDQDTMVSIVVDNFDRLLEMHVEKISSLTVF